MRILVLDDEADRVLLFYQKLQELHQLVVVNNIEDAAKAMSTPFDAIFLDNDLWNKCGVEDNNGMELAVWMTTWSNGGLPQPLDAKIIVHSTNGIAAEFMTKELKEAGYKDVRWMPWGLVLTSPEEALT